MLGQGTSPAAGPSCAGGIPTWAGGGSPPGPACAHPGDRACLPSWGGFPCLPQQGLSQRPCLEQAGARVEGIPALPGRRRAGDRRSRGGTAAESSPWPLRSAQGEKSTLQTRIPPTLQYQTPLNPLQGPSKGSTAKSWDFPSLCLPPAPRLLQRLALSPGRLGTSWHIPCQPYPTLLGTDGLLSLCLSPVAGCNKPLAPTPGFATATALPVWPHAGNSKDAMWAWGQSPKQPVKEPRVRRADSHGPWGCNGWCVPWTDPAAGLVGKSLVPTLGKEWCQTQPSHFHPSYSSIPRPDFISQPSRQLPCPCSQRAGRWGEAGKLSACRMGLLPPTLPGHWALCLRSFRRAEGLERSRDAYP